MRRTTLAALAVMLLAAFALMAAGCGGGDSNSAATTEAATTETADTEEATTEEATTEEATTEEATTEEATTEAATTTSDGSAVSAENCKEFAQLNTKLANVFSSSSPDAATLKKEAEALNELADNAPSEIKADFKTLAAYVNKAVDIFGNLKSGQVPDAATLQKAQGLQADAQKVSAAGQNIAAWAQKNCHA